MNFNMRFIIALILIVLLLISFVLIVVEIYTFNNRTPFKFTKGAVTVEFKDINKDEELKFAEIGTRPDELVSSTQHYRNLSVFIHIVAMISGVYLIYSS